MTQVGGANLPAINVQIKPRIQKDRWSLYWKVQSSSCLLNYKEEHWTKPVDKAHHRNVTRKPMHASSLCVMPGKVSIALHAFAILNLCCKDWQRKFEIQRDEIQAHRQESMETKTEKLSDLALEISPSAKVADLHSMLSGKLEWPSTEGLERCLCNFLFIY